MSNNTVRKEIPVFFSVDNNYIPFLAVALRSILDNADGTNKFSVYVLTDENISEKNKQRIKKIECDTLSVDYVDVRERIEPIKDLLRLRDYYTPSIYYRLFIPSMFPQYKKAVYIDSDIVVLADLADLFDIDLEGNMVGAIRDEIIANNDIFKIYAEKAVGTDRHDLYFNSGVLLMDLDKFREKQIEDKFVSLLKEYHFETVAPDQDYLNALCRGSVKYLAAGWNKMSSPVEFDGELKLIHYNMFDKPWLYSDIKYKEYFWKYAEQTDYLDEIKAMKFKDEKKEREKAMAAVKAMEEGALRIANSPVNFRTVITDKKEG